MKLEVLFVLGTLALLGLPACGDDPAETTPGGADQTSGGEDTGGGEGQSGPGAEGGGGSGGGTASTNDGPVSAADSPWGSPLADTGAPLPGRKAMNPSASDSNQQGIQAARSGNLDAAKRAFEKAFGADPNSYEAAYNLGVVEDRLGNELRAIDYYQRSLKLQPDYERAARGIVTIHARRGDVAKAIAFIQPIAKYWVRNLHLQAIYADALVYAGRYDEAIKAAREALRRDERFVPAMISIVKASLRQGRNELALSVLEQAMKIDKENAELLYLRGQMYLEENGRLREALDAFQKAVQLEPDYAEARMALGAQQLVGANYGEALKNFKVAAELVPTLYQVHLNLADAYRANKEWEKAKVSFEKAMGMKSPLPEAHFNL
ncbi:MAG: tetratricopeptide repeat protein, partial [Myxococcales bacterium]|nr:tetratricopeptide repeat protein [Myxococcales bacterium]